MARGLVLATFLAAARGAGGHRHRPADNEPIRPEGHETGPAALLEVEEAGAASSHSAFPVHPVLVGGAALARRAAPVTEPPLGSALMPPLPSGPIFQTAPTAAGPLGAVAEKVGKEASSESDEDDEKPKKQAQAKAEAAKPEAAKPEAAKPKAKADPKAVSKESGKDDKADKDGKKTDAAQLTEQEDNAVAEAKQQAHGEKEPDMVQNDDLDLMEMTYPIMKRASPKSKWQWVPAGRQTSTVGVPAKWAQGFESGFILEEYANSAVAYSGRARLNINPTIQVAFRAWPYDNLHTFRDLHMAKLMSSTGCVPTIYESIRKGGLIYTLKESLGSRRNLFRWVAEHEREEIGLPQIKLEDSMPIMIDFLRGVARMEERGIVHGDLSEVHMYVVGDDKRGIIGDFKHSFLEDGSLRSSLIKTDRGVSAFRHAPEMLELPNNITNNVWQLGLVFAHIVFGDEAYPNPKTVAMWEKVKPGYVDDMSFEGRMWIRDAIRDDYRLQDQETFKAMSDEKYDPLKNIIVGMLDVDPLKRLKASEALVMMEEYSAAMDIPILPPRQPATLPEGWYRL